MNNDSIFPSSRQGPGDPSLDIPTNKEMELSVLGSILIEPLVIEQLDFLNPGDFFFSAHQEAFRRMRSIWYDNEPIDATMVADGDAEIRACLMDASAAVPTAIYAAHYARKVKELAQKRRYLVVAEKLAGYALNGKTPEDIAEYLQAEVEKQEETGIANPFDRWHQQGITAADAASEEVLERKYLVEDIIREKSLSIFYGNPGDHKSMLVMDMVMCLASGRPWLMPLPIEGNEQRSFETMPICSLWLNYDQAHEDVIERLGAMNRAYGGGENVLAISHSDPPAILTSERQARKLGQMIGAEGFKLVVIDSLLDVRGTADLKDADMGDVLRMWRIVAQEAGAAIILISHSTKESQDLYGSQFIKAKLDHSYHVTRKPGTDYTTIETKKQRSYGTSAAINAHWTYTHREGTRTLETARFWGDSTVGHAAHPNNTTQEAIRTILMASPGRGFTVKQLANFLNENRDEDDQLAVNAIRNAANRLSKNELNVAKSPIDSENMYHYGQLNTHG